MRSELEAPYAAALAHLEAMVSAGADAAAVSRFVVMCGPVSIALSHVVEDRAWGGTTWEAAFEILCGDGPDCEAPTLSPFFCTEAEAMAAVEAAISADELRTGVPPHGALIRFEVTPVTSYATPGEAYRVTVQDGYVFLRNEARGHGTNDRTWAYARAAWRLV